MPGVTYTRSYYIDTTASSATLSGSGSGTVYTVPSDSFIIICSVGAEKSVAPVTGWNFYVNGGVIATGTSNSNKAIQGQYAGPGHVISYDTTGGTGTPSGTVYFVKFKNAT